MQKSDKNPYPRGGVPMLLNGTGHRRDAYATLNAVFGRVGWTNAGPKVA